LWTFFLILVCGQRVVLLLLLLLLLSTNQVDRSHTSNGCCLLLLTTNQVDGPDTGSVGWCKSCVLNNLLPVLVVLLLVAR
jgi:hypothetical protein